MLLTDDDALALAADLEALADPGARHYTGCLAVLDEALSHIDGIHDARPVARLAEVATARRAFARARTAHKDSYAAGHYSDAAWDAAVAAAATLATALRATVPPEGPRPALEAVVIPK